MRKSVPALFALLLLTSSILAQTRTLRGKVVSADNNPVQGASILVKGGKPSGATATKTSATAGTVTATTTGAGYDGNDDDC